MELKEQFARFGITKRSVLDEGTHLTSRNVSYLLSNVVKCTLLASPAVK